MAPSLGERDYQFILVPAFNNGRSAFAAKRVT